MSFCSDVGPYTLSKVNARGGSPGPADGLARVMVPLGMSGMVVSEAMLEHIFLK